MEGSKTASIADDMIIYIENSKDSTETLWELMYEFSKVAEYKTNIQKSVAFLYTNNKNIWKRNKSYPMYDYIKKQ